jgi:hypothetical protein
LVWNILKNGAGDGNRTHVISLGIPFRQLPTTNINNKNSKILGVIGCADLSFIVLDCSELVHEWTNWYPRTPPASANTPVEYEVPGISPPQTKFPKRLGPAPRDCGMDLGFQKPVSQKKFI